jgi:hypothetical protein
VTELNPHRALAPLLAALLLVAGWHLWQAQGADAQVPIKAFSMDVTTTQAGGHPAIVTMARVGNGSTEGPLPCRCNSLRDITVNTPPGVVGSPSNLPRCTAVQLGLGACPVDSQVGLQVLKFSDGSEPPQIVPVYNMIPAPSQLALFASPLPVISFYSSNTVISARTESDYGLEFKTVGIPTILEIFEIAQITWGVPADPVHDPLRFPLAASPKSVSCAQGDRNPLPELVVNEYPVVDCPRGTFNGFFGVPANSPRVSFQSNPTSCVGPLTAAVDTVGYDLSTEHALAPFPTPTGCDQLSFNPSLSAKPTSPDADSPAGVDIELTVPQSLSPTTPSSSQIRTTRIRFPAGMSINPNAADGKLSCTADEARIGTREQARCPEFAKIGTLEIESAALPGVLPGAIYLGEPLPGDRYRIFLTADGFSLHVKLAGSARLDPLTGQLTTIFVDLPQTPFQRFAVHIFGAERGLLATPEQCGRYAVESEFVPWATGLPIQSSTQFFEIESGPGGSPCPPAQRPFAPVLKSGVTDSTGGHHTRFVLDLERRDGDQSLAALKVSTPAGFSARLVGVPFCPDSTLSALTQTSYLGITEMTSPACAASRVGTTVATVGAGSRPLSLTGAVYLAGPYKGSPLSLAVVTPAVSGPYDLGNVVARVAVAVDPRTAQVSAISDPLPQILEGIPLRLRRVLVMLDRDGFALNPTNCAPASVNAMVLGAQGAEASLSSHFQVANCGALDFQPKLKLAMRGSTKRRGNPAIHATLTAGAGEANIRRASVTLPRGQLLDNAHIGSVCTRVDFARRTCPAGSMIGTAEAVSPLLDRPLRGNAYLRSSTNELPDLAIDLRGQVDFELVGRVDTVNERLRTEFQAVPDVPVSRFELRLQGGHKGLLINSEDLCGSTKRATVKLAGQNGKRVNRRPAVDVACPSRPKRRGS